MNLHLNILKTQTHKPQGF